MPIARLASFPAFRRGLLRSLPALPGASALRDVTALGSGTLLAQAILFFAAPVFLRLYQPGDFGLYSFTYASISLIATLATWKIERLIVVVPARRTAVRLLTALIAIAAGAAILLLVLISLAWLIADDLPASAPEKLALMWPAPLSMFILVATTGLRFYSIRLRRFKAVAVAQASRALVFTAGTIATALLWSGSAQYGALVMISWQVAADTCAFLAQLGANRGTARLIIVRPRLRSSLAVLLIHRKTVGVLALTQIISSVNEQIPISTVALAFGVVPAGWYSLANQFVFAPCTIIASAVSDVVNQRLSRLHAARQPFSHLVLRMTVGLAIAGIVPFAMVAVFAPTLLPILVGPHWLGASQSVSVLTVASYLYFIEAPAGNVALIVGARRYIVLWHMLRMGRVVGLAAAALFGWVPYAVWLILSVAGDALLYILDVIVEFILARAAESKWRQGGTRDA
jgi:O-antigen/teichoic acid export membrane protein